MFIYLFISHNSHKHIKTQFFFFFPSLSKVASYLCLSAFHLRLRLRPFPGTCFDAFSVQFCLRSSLFFQTFKSNLGPDSLGCSI
ncbi:hypothetical protein AHAS_Ahas18G0043100 [Arachis hypogaea]